MRVGNMSQMNLHNSMRNNELSMGLYHFIHLNTMKLANERIRAY